MTRSGSTSSGGHTVRIAKGATLTLRRCHLRVVAGPDEGLELTSDFERVRVGAHSTNDLVLAHDLTASRHHFEIQHTERGYLLVDLASTNGTFLEGRRVERAYLAEGAQIRMGSSTLAFASEDERITLEPHAETTLGEMVGGSLAMRQIFSVLRKVAALPVPILVVGEPGVGKGLIAQVVHQISGRKKSAFVSVDATVLTADLLERELFGPGGAVEKSSGGTLVIKGGSELPMGVQERLMERLTSDAQPKKSTAAPVGARLIVTSGKDLAPLVRQGSFRADLFTRLSAVTVAVPPLRERREDIPLLVQRLLQDVEVTARSGSKRLLPATLAKLQAYGWPGNVRELYNVVAHAVSNAQGDTVELAQLPPRVLGKERPGALGFNEHLSFHEAKEQMLTGFEREFVSQVLKRCEGNLSRAARESGMHRKSIERLVKKYQLDVRVLKKR